MNRCVLTEFLYETVLFEVSQIKHCHEQMCVYIVQTQAGGMFRCKIRIFTYKFAKPNHMFRLYK